METYNANRNESDIEQTILKHLDFVRIIAIDHNKKKFYRYNKDEIIAEANLALVKAVNRAKYRADRSIRSYIALCVKYALREYDRQQPEVSAKGLPRYSGVYHASINDDNFYCDAKLPHLEDVSRIVERRQIIGLFDQLPNDLQKLFYLSYVEGKGDLEISKLIGNDTGWIARRKLSCKKKIAKLFKPVNLEKQL